MSFQHVVSARARALDRLIIELSLQGLVSSWVFPLPVPPTCRHHNQGGLSVRFLYLFSRLQFSARAQARLTTLQSVRVYRSESVAGCSLWLTVYYIRSGPGRCSWVLRSFIQPITVQRARAGALDYITV